MGSIIQIYPNQHYWKLTGKEGKLRFTGEKVIEVVYGSGNCFRRRVWTVCFFDGRTSP